MGEKIAGEEIEGYGGRDIGDLAERGDGKNERFASSRALLSWRNEITKKGRVSIFRGGGCVIVSPL